MAKKHTFTIEINGRRYDAVTGAPVDDASIPAIQPIDDVVRVSKHPATAEQPLHATPAVKPITPAPAPVVKAATTPVTVRTVHHTSAHKPQHGKTLMRKAVVKPQPELKRHTKAITRTDILAKVPQVTVAPKRSVSGISPQRQGRAEQVAKSERVSKFAPGQPLFASVPPATPQPAPSVRPTIPALQRPLITTSTTRSMDVFQRALKHANAHEQPPFDSKKAAKSAKKHHKAQHSKPARHHIGAIIAVSLAVVLLTAFIAYQNKAGLILRRASAAAGFHAVLPSYEPQGYSLGNFKYSPGVVAVNYRNNATRSDYSLTQKTTHLNNQTLLTSYIAPKNPTYQTLQSGARTIYVYGDNNAAWVNNGVLYQVSSNGSLSTNDVLHIATSM